MSDTQVIEGQVEGQVEGEQVVAEATEGTPEGSETQARAKTQYAGKHFQKEALDELPDDEPVGQSRTYFDLLSSFVADETATTHWNVVARFGTRDGAKSVGDQLNRQVAGKPIKSDHDSKTGKLLNKLLPEYEGYHWRFAARRVQVENHPDPTHRDSVLYAKLVEGPAPETPYKASDAA